MKKMMATVGVVALLVGNSFAQEKMANEPVRMHKGGELRQEKGQHDKMADIPNLTDQQKAKIKSIKDENRKKCEPQREEMKQLRSKLHEMKTSEKPNVDDINSLIDLLASKKAEIEKEKIASEIKVRSILTPEQRKAVDEKHAENMKIREEKQKERKELREDK
ncbi:MAG: Spy/CpxP family protein refolding chaperone [Flavobacteriales bacterium]|nr:Spy/CpxP family protein refolding chaperone [Flavobacteriales bacterium]